MSRTDGPRSGLGMPSSLVQALLGAMLLTFACPRADAQVGLSVQGGLSYIEHVSTGVTLTFGKRHAASFLCGSNLFTNMSDFRNLFAEYSYSFVNLKLAKFVPRLGVKGGDSYYTDEYYRWHVLHVIPFAGCSLPLTARTTLFFDAGAAFSFEQSVERIKPGEIGHYRELLPEVKLGILYPLYRSK